MCIGVSSQVRCTCGVAISAAALNVNRLRGAVPDAVDAGVAAPPPSTPLSLFGVSMSQRPRFCTGGADFSDDDETCLSSPDLSFSLISFETAA
jgi:hypothetical protein